MVNILIVGSGGREHSLGWKLSQSTHTDKIFYAPGNGGTENNIQIKVEQIDDLADFAQKNDCFTIVGPEIPLAKGIVDEFKKRNLNIFGPTQDAARLESSKIWAKKFMRKHSIQTPDFESFDDPNQAIEYAKSVDYNLVVKADGLAAGKGVVVCSSTQQVIDAINKIQVDKAFGNAGLNIILEQRLDGIEASFIAICDGTSAIPLQTARDHKRIYDGNKGPNTGGMGAYSPAGVISDSLYQEIHNKIIKKTISSMKQENCPFTGFLYAGIMLYQDIPFVLEYNVRMGDPECQPILFRMESDLFDYLWAALDSKLDTCQPISWTRQTSVCVVLASKGYPNSYQTNQVITGLESNNSMIFHAGTRRENQDILTNGGRVLGVTALGVTKKDAADKAYQVIKKINWESKYYRTDIGLD